MAWTVLPGHRGDEWAVDWDGVNRLLRAYCRSRAVLSYSKRVKETNGFFGPDVYCIDVDWGKVRAEVDRISMYMMCDWQVAKGRENQFHALVTFRKETLDNEAKFQKMQKDATKESFTNIEKAVRTDEKIVEGLKKVRDTSATIVIIGAGFVSGGAAVALVGAGSGLDGVAKWQDKHNLKDAVLTAGTDVFTAAIGLPGVAKTFEKAPLAKKAAYKLVLIASNAVGAGVQSYVQYHDLKKATHAAKENAASSIIGLGIGAAAKKGAQLVTDNLSVQEALLIAMLQKKLKNRAAPILAKLTAHFPDRLKLEAEAEEVERIKDWVKDKTIEKAAAEPAAKKVVPEDEEKEKEKEKEADHGESAAEAKEHARHQERAINGVHNVRTKKAAATSHPLEDTGHVLNHGNGSEIDFVVQTAMRKLGQNGTAAHYSDHFAPMSTGP